MNKLIIAAAVLLGFTSCNNKEKSAEEIRKEINDYKVEIVELENKIIDLESLLETQGMENDIQNLIVGVEELKKVNFTHYIDVVGNVEASEEAFISSEINGLINNIPVEEGQFVRRGDLLASLDNTLLIKGIDELKTQLTLANTLYNKQKSLWEKGIGSEMDYLTVKNNKESLEKKLETLNAQLLKANIYAPYNAFVEDIYQQQGEFASPGRNIMHIVNLDNYRITAELSESYIPYLKKGDSAFITFPTFPDIKIKRPIEIIGSVVNPNNRTFKIQIPVNNYKNILKPNIMAHIKLSDKNLDSVIVVPSIVIKNNSKGESYVYVVNEKDGKYFSEKRYIQLGESYGNRTTVQTGLKEGELVVTQGYNLVKNGSIISIK